MTKPAWINSLAFRLLLASLLILPLFASVSGAMLNKVFQNSLLTSETENLRSQFYILLGAAEWLDDQVWLPEQLAEPRFTAVNSGLYAWVSDTDGKVLWASPSSRLLTSEETPSLTSFNAGTEQFGSFTDNGSDYFFYGYDVVWETSEGNNIALRFILWKDKASYLATLHKFRQQLWEWLGAMTLLLLLSLALIMRWGLSPLRRLARDLHAIKHGEQEQLPGSYPQEIQPVTDNFNQLLHSERQQRDRYRNTLGDLAHSLKTPLAVIRGYLPQLSTKAVVREQLDEQVSRMDTIIRHQLQRAVQRNQSQLNQSSTRVAPQVERLKNSLDKVYHDKQMTCEIALASDLCFAGSLADLMEVLGNLLDNAYKYGKTVVRISGNSEAKLLHIYIDDDGLGVPPERRFTILQRGQRADTVTSGQGIGLAVAVDIISSYGGSLAIDQSALGGACFIVSLPAATNQPAQQKRAKK